MDTIPPMSYLEFCRAYWKEGYHWPYPVPQYDDPSPNASYREFAELRRKMGREEDTYDRGLNLIRACYDYLAGPERKQVQLPQVLTFLTQPCEDVLTTLSSYQPVYCWLLRASLLLEDNNERDIFLMERVKGAVQSAKRFIQECLDYPAIEAQAYQEAAKQTEYQRSVAEREKKSAELERKLDRQNMIADINIKILIFGLGLALGWLAAHSG